MFQYASLRDTNFSKNCVFFLTIIRPPPQILNIINVFTFWFPLSLFSGYLVYRNQRRSTMRLICLLYLFLKGFPILLFFIFLAIYLLRKPLSYRVFHCLDFADCIFQVLTCSLVLWFSCKLVVRSRAVLTNSDISWATNASHICNFFLFVVKFVIHWNESAMGLHVFPIPIPPPTSLSTRSL